MYKLEFSPKSLIWAQKQITPKAEWGPRTPGRGAGVPPGQGLCLVPDPRAEGGRRGGVRTRRSRSYRASTSGGFRDGEKSGASPGAPRGVVLLLGGPGDVGAPPAATSGGGAPRAAVAGGVRARSPLCSAGPRRG